MSDDFPIKGQFGERVHGPVDDGSIQWARGANRLVDMACKASDELEWEHAEDGNVTVRNTKYDMERTEDMLHLALWILERDIRVEYGDPFFDEREPPKETGGLISRLFG